jgi:hypothetical protein
MQIETYTLPEHWLSALFNGDDSGLDESDCEALEAFTDSVVADYGQAWPVDYDESGAGFMRYHDAQPFGVLACDCVEVSFDVTQRGAAA